MKSLERKRQLVEELADLHKALNVKQLYCYPKHKTTKDWLADVASIFKYLDEKSDYQEFVRLSKTITPNEGREIRKKAANEIDAFTRRKVAEWKRHDFSYLDVKEALYKGKITNYWNFVNPFWLVWKFLVLVWGNKIISAVVIIIGLLGIDYSLAGKNTLWIVNTILGLFNR